MNLVMINIKCVLPEPPVLLTGNADHGFSLKKADREIPLNAMEVQEEHIIPEIGSLVGNVYFIFDNELQIDPLLKEDTEEGFFLFKEPEQTSEIDVARTKLGNDEVLSFYFDDVATARRFIDKKIFGELYLLNSDDHQLIFYPQHKEIFLSASNSIELGFVGLLDIKNTLSAPSASITEIKVEATDQKTYKIEETEAVFELPVWKRYRLEFPSDGLHIIRMNRGKTEVKRGDGKRYWQPQDEILKIFVCGG